MKQKHLILITIMIAVLLLANCDRSGPDDPFAGERNFDRDASYALGLNIGAGLRGNMMQDSIIPDFDQFLEGFRVGLLDKNPRFDLHEAREKIDQSFNALSDERNAEARESEIAFLAENARKPGVIITDSGLQYEVLRDADGPKPGPYDAVRVHFELRMADGTLFDNSYEHGEPLEIALMSVIPGWSEGLQLMSVGSTYRFHIPSDIGYGQFGGGPFPPYSTLVFVVDLIEILSEYNE